MSRFEPMKILGTYYSKDLQGNTIDFALSGRYKKLINTRNGKKTMKVESTENKITLLATTTNS